MDNKKRRVIVIGGGAAGMMAAGTAGSRGLEVVLIEKNKRPGRKLLITGKGRCNITNAAGIEDFFDNIPTNSSFLYSALYTFSNYQLLNLLNRLGLETKVERGGRVFPVSDRSKDVLKALEKFLRENQVNITQGEVIQVLKEDRKISGVKLKDGRRIHAGSVIIATGGLSYPTTGSTGDGYRFAEVLGHKVTPLRASLVPLEVEEDWVRELRSLTLKNIAISVLNNREEEIHTDFGELSFTDYGVSGPVILSASSHLKGIKKGQYRIKVDLKPALSEKKLDNRIRRDFRKYSNKFFGNSLGDLLPSALIPVIIRLSKIPYDKTVNQITRDERMELVNLLKNLTLHIKGFRPVKEAIITSGGIEVDEINPGTMESKLIDGLFFAGEVIDVDAYTGGYNLQIAFSTGYLAGLNC